MENIDDSSKEFGLNKIGYREELRKRQQLFSISDKILEILGGLTTEAKDMITLDKYKGNFFILGNDKLLYY